MWKRKVICVKVVSKNGYFALSGLRLFDPPENTRDAPAFAGRINMLHLPRIMKLRSIPRICKEKHEDWNN